MKPKIVIGCFLLFSAATITYSSLYQQNRYDYRLAVCAMFKNEGPWLREWVLYHHEILGVDHFYLYNNDSEDNYAEVLSPWIERGIVELIDWNSADESHRINAGEELVWMPYQLGAYNDCIQKRALGKAKWVAMIDIDEFIVPLCSISSFYRSLQQMEKRRKGTIKCMWKVFGTSNVWDLSQGELLIEKMTLCAQDAHPWHQLAKSIHRPEAVLFCPIHDNPTLAPRFRRAHADPNELRIYHYWTRTEKACLEKRKMSKTKSPAFFQQLNQIEDRTMHQYALPLKRILHE